MIWPTEPTYIVAQNAYQTLLELQRQHPEDPELPAAVVSARALRDRLWRERDRRAMLTPAAKAAAQAALDRELFDAVQNFNGSPRGRIGKSNRLLARLKLLECGTCGSKLAVSQRSGRPGDYNFFYRCTNNTCDGRASISAPMIERLVTDRTRELCEGLVGRASADGHCVERKQDLAAAEDGLRRLLRRLEAAESEDEPEAIRLVLDARKARNAAQEAYDRALATGIATRIAVTAAEVLDHGTPEGKRELIAAVIERIVVGKGKGPERVRIEGRVQ